MLLFNYQIGIKIKDAENKYRGSYAQNQENSGISSHNKTEFALFFLR